LFYKSTHFYHLAAYPALHSTPPPAAVPIQGIAWYACRLLGYTSMGFTAANTGGTHFSPGLVTTFLFFYHLYLMEQKSNSSYIQQLQGKWYIHYTNFPMWLKGNKTNPAFNYTLGTRKGISGLVDEVSYFKNGKQKFIRGFDFPVENNPSAFVWRGNGWMSILSSKWKIIYMSEDKQWAVIEFEKTLFTPAGFDVVGKEENLDEKQVNVIEEYIQKKLPLLHRLK